MTATPIPAAHTASPAERGGFAFGAVALVFTIVMAFTTVPTPLWPLFAQRDGLSSLMVTVVFAVYALAVALSLFLVGHLSDCEPGLSRNLDLVERLRAVAGPHDTSPGSIAVAWTVRKPAVDAAIVGFRRPDQVDPILPAASIELTAQDLAEIEASPRVTR
jgi:MFS family permease